MSINRPSEICDFHAWDDLYRYHPVNHLDNITVQKIRQDFPILSEKINGRDLIWLDNAATTQKPTAVIERIVQFYLHENSNVHRGAHTLAARATDAYEEARRRVADFLHAEPKEIIFVRGTTEGINLVAQTFGKQNLQPGDEILLTELEHHANIVPWQMLREETCAVIKVAPVDDNGQILLSEYEKLLNQKTRLVAAAHVSNALGTIAPVEEMVRMAHRAGARILVDGAQAVSHLRVDVASLDCDFYVFSGHKIYGPTGIGAVYCKSEILRDLPPYQGGGNMISDVTFDNTRYQMPPMRLEAGTGSIADAVGLGAALEYIEMLGIDWIFTYEHQLLHYAMDRMRSIPGLSLVGTANEKTSILSFLLDGFSNEEVGRKLNEQGIAVRAGHHCAQPILRRFGLESTVRPSLAFYNTKAEIDEMVRVLKRIQKRQSNFYLHNPFFVVY